MNYGLGRPRGIRLPQYCVRNRGARVFFAISRTGFFAWSTTSPSVDPAAISALSNQYRGDITTVLELTLQACNQDYQGRLTGKPRYACGAYYACPRAHSCHADGCSTRLLLAAVPPRPAPYSHEITSQPTGPRYLSHLSRNT